MPFKETFLFGLMIAFYVGPIAVLLIHIGINHGLWEVSKCSVGVALADFTYAIISFTVGNYLILWLVDYKFQIELFAASVLIMFGLFMLYKVYASYKLMKQRNISELCCEEDLEELKTVKMKSPGFVGIYLLTALNPLTIISFTAFSAQIYVENASFVIIILLSLTLFSASLFAQLSFGILSHIIKPYFENYKVMVGFDIISGLAIILFGVYGLVKI